MPEEIGKSIFIVGDFNNPLLITGRKRQKMSKNKKYFYDTANNLTQLTFKYGTFYLRRAQYTFSLRTHRYLLKSYYE